MDLYAGFDGGGTKTACVLIDGEGRILGRGLGGPSNHLFCGIPAAQEAVRTSLERAFADAGRPVQPLRCALIASAAVELGEGDDHVDIYKSGIESDELYCESDIFPVWFAATGCGPAVISIAGTGAVTYYLTEDGYVKADGWGPDVGDDGSGYALGLRAIRAVLRMADGRMAENETFAAAVYRHYGVQSPLQLTKRLRSGDKRSAIASVARCVVEMGERNEPLSLDLLRDSAREIVLAIETVLRRARPPHPVPLILSGGLLRADGLLYRLVQEAVQKHPAVSAVLAPTSDPALAAARAARHKSKEIGAGSIVQTKTDGSKWKGDAE